MRAEGEPLSVIAADESMLWEILAIENASFTCPWSETSFREAFASDRITVYAALSGERVTGFSCLLVVGDEGEILNIAASPTDRRRGIGQALLSRMLDDCASRGTASVYLEVRESNLPARSLYRKNGFAPVGVRRNYYTKPREDAVLMMRTISPAAEGQL